MGRLSESDPEQGESNTENDHQKTGELKERMHSVAPQDSGPSSQQPIDACRRLDAAPEHEQAANRCDNEAPRGIHRKRTHSRPLEEDVRSMPNHRVLTGARCGTLLKWMPFDFLCQTLDGQQQSVSSAIT